jgi:O-antigen/teichoic acid export membrane protein
MSHSYKDGSMSNLVRLLRKSILILCLPYLLWLIIGLIFSEEIIEIFYVEKFAGYGSLFILLLISTTIDFVFAPLANALQVLEKTRTITISLIVGALVTLLIGSLLINEFGLIGAGISSIVSIVATIIWRVYVILKSTSFQKQLI